MNWNLHINIETFVVIFFSNIPSLTYASRFHFRYYLPFIYDSYD